MRRNPSTVVVLAGEVPSQTLAAIGRSMNVTLINTEGDGLDSAAGALRRAAGITSPYVLVNADPLAAVAAAWTAMWDVRRDTADTSDFELRGGEVVGAWRAGRFELPDYYLHISPDDAADGPPDFYLGPLRSARPNRVAVAVASEPVSQAAEVLRALGSLRHGPWWPPLDEIIGKARDFYPATLLSMAPIVVRAQRTVNAPASVVYSYIADMEHHQRFLPGEFSDFTVVSGGVGAGTIITFTVTAAGRRRDYRMRIDEPEPGRVLTETDQNSSLVTTYTVTPAEGGSLVEIETTWQGATGVGGFFERTFAPPATRRIYAQALDRLDAYARDHPAP